MFAQMPVTPEEVRAAPMPVAQLKAGGAGVGPGYVYAAGNRDSGVPLDIWEALARAMRSRASVDSGLGMSVSGDHGERAEKAAEQQQPSMPSARPPREAVQHPYSQHRPRILDFSTQQNTSFAEPPRLALFCTASDCSKCRGADGAQHAVRIVARHRLTRVVAAGVAVPV